MQNLIKKLLKILIVEYGEYLHKISDVEFVEKANKLITNSYAKNRKITRKKFDQLKKVVEAFNQQPTNKDQQQNSINIPSFEIENHFVEIQLPPGVYELVDINNTIKQILSDSDLNSTYKQIQYQ